MASPKFRPSPELCERLKARREARGMTIRETAFRAGMSTAVYWRIEGGHREPRYSDLEGIAGALACSVRDLVPPKPSSPAGAAR
jgi:transcriptional regulator with XRE-family HTH domain